MGGGIHKKILSEVHLIYGDVAMPKGFEIDRDKLSTDTLQSQITDSEFPFSRMWDMLNTFIRDHVNVEYNINLINKQTWGNIYKPNEITIPLLNIDPVDLRNSPDYTCIYGIDINKDCDLVIEYNDNRRAGRTWHIPLKNNKYYIFPSTQRYFFTANKSSKLNIILTSTYEYI